MRKTVCYIAVAASVASIALAGSVADARPHHKAKVAKKVKQKKHRESAPRVADAGFEITDTRDEDPDDVDSDDGSDVAPLLHVHERLARHAKDWHIAIGPYAWASAVDASVSVDGMKVDSPVDFAKLKHDIKYGGEILAEARYRRFAITGDLMFGAIGIETGSAVGPLMVSVKGEVTSLLLDSSAGYLLAGNEHSVLSVEARGGIRYQRTAVKAQVSLEGAGVAQPDVVFAASDALVGARVFLRPRERFFFTGTADVGVFGASSSTWSASLDASLRIKSHALLSLGYRTLTMDRSDVAVVLHGPRAAIQIVF
jgi:hypothetical protein